MTQIGKPRIPAGDTFRLVFDVVDSAGAVMPLEGASISWELFLDEDDATPLLTKVVGEGITIDAVPGRFTVLLDPLNTVLLVPRDYWHKSIVTFDDGTVATVNRSWLSILP